MAKKDESLQLELDVRGTAQPQPLPQPVEGNCFQRYSRSGFEWCSDTFAQLGHYIGENPWRFVIFSVVVALLLAPGMGMLDQEGRPEELWMPTDSEAATDKDVVDAHYPRTSRMETVILVPADGDMLSVTNFNLMLSAYNSLAAATAEYNGATLTWSNMCVLVGSTCQAINALEPFSYTVPATRTQILTTINSIPDGTSRLLQMTYGTQIDATTMLGGITTATNNDITGAKAAKLIFMVRNDQVRSSKGGWETPDAEAWEKSWLEIAENLALSGMTVSRFATRTRRDEFGAAIKGDVLTINIAVVLLLLYCMLTIGKLRKPETRVTLTVLGLISVGLAAISGIGLVNGYFQVKYTPLHGVLTFLLLGLGVDDMFVITTAFDDTNPLDSIPKRMSDSLRHSASAVMLTSFTDTLAFLIGAMTVLPALSYFCITAGVCIFFIFVFQVLLFVPFLVIDERRRAAGRNDVFCCCHTCCCESCICSGSDPSDVENMSGDDSAKVQPLDADRVNCVNMRPGLIRRLLGKVSGPLVLDTRGNILGLSLFLVVFVVGIVGLTRLKVDSDIDRFIPAGSYALDYQDADDTYFTYVGRQTFAYVMNPSYYTKATEMASLRTSMMNNNGIVSSTVNSWYHDFAAYNTATPCTTGSEAAWYTCLNAFLGSSSGIQFRRHVVFTDNTASGSSSNPIVISRIPANHIVLKNSNGQVDAMDSFRNTVDAYDSSLAGTGGDPFGYSFFYPSYEGYKVVEQEAIRNLCLALASILVIVALLIPSIVISLLIFFVISCSILEVAGFMHWWGLYLDNVTVVMLIVSIGISVDYAAHIGHAFQTYRSGTVPEKAARAMTEMGTCVWHGFFSTFLAIVVLAPSKSYVFISFFKELFLASLLGIFNGLIVLPILLKLLGGFASPLAKRESEPDVISSNDLTTKASAPPMETKTAIVAS
eukprot:TRINITY_DN1506_c0_g1_i2.p1 TRINITY_DN1506_c0_g1~~TRINITY_DN1506_c0_g1_i2.p1  ORF type:complete len:936 (+),score=184.20 TRINITY_DN1506_c0_g1_i2:115-2922(+)